MLFAGCDSNTVPKRSEELVSRIRALDDSIIALSPHSRDMIARGLEEAGDSITWYEYYLRYGKYWLSTQTPDSLVRYTDRTLAYLGTLPDGPRVNGIRAHAYEYKATWYQRFRFKLDESVKLRTAAYGYMMKSDDATLLPDVCANMADTYVLMNDMAMAASWYRRALFLVDSLQMPEMKSVTLYLGLAQIYCNLEDYDSSLKYYTESGKFYDRMQPGMKIYYLNNFGNYYYFIGDYDSALTLFLRLQKLLEQYGDESVDMATCRINLADVYLNIGDMRQAGENLEKADSLFTAYGVDVGRYYANTIRIGMAVKQGRMADVEGILRNEHLNPPLEYTLVGIRNRYLRDYYKATGNWRAAYHNMEHDIHARDSIAEGRQHMRASEIMQRLKEDTLSLHHTIAMERKDAMLRTTHAMTATLVVIGVLILLWWVALSRKRKLQTELDMMQLRLDSVRTRISPHFIFNVLNNRISTADKKETDELMMLARLIRANLDISRNTYVSLAGEMEFVRYYLDIERAMLGDDFTFTIEAPSDDVLQAITIPTMFVQLLVENAIKHGLKGKDGEKRLTITITTGDNGTDITVTDNGCGFDIRSVNGQGTRTGLDIIRHTMRVVNRRIGRNEMTFGLRNVKDAMGNVTGCESKLHIPVLPSSAGSPAH